MLSSKGITSEFQKKKIQQKPNMDRCCPDRLSDNAHKIRWEKILNEILSKT